MNVIDTIIKDEIEDRNLALRLFIKASIDFDFFY